MKRLGIINAWNNQRGYGFIRDAEFSYDGKVVPINDRSRDDTFLHVKAVIRSGISPDALSDDVAIRFDAVPNRRHVGRFEAAHIELVAA
jgi:cold shock CspA family protein